MSRELRVEVGNKAGLGYVDIPQAWGLNNPQQDSSRQLIRKLSCYYQTGRETVHYILLSRRQEQAYTESLQVEEYGIEF